MPILDLPVQPGITEQHTDLAGGFTLYEGITEEGLWMQHAIADSKENDCNIWYVPKFPLPNTDDNGVYRETRTRWEKQWRDNEGIIVKREFLRDPVTKELDLISPYKDNIEFAATLAPFLSGSMFRGLFYLYFGWRQPVTGPDNKVIQYTPDELVGGPTFDYHTIEPDYLPEE